MTDESNIVPFPRGQFERSQNAREALYADEPVLAYAPWSRRTPSVSQHRCDHCRSGTVVDQEARRVYCRGCGVELDPVAVLAWIAHHRENLVATGFRLRHEVDHLHERLERLRKDETNAKSRIRAARKRAGDDRPALEAAAQARFPGSHMADRAIPIGGYRSWDDLSSPQREVVVTYVRAIIEAYLGALAALDDARTA